MQYNINLPQVAEDLEEKMNANAAMLLKVSKDLSWPDAKHLDHAVTQSIHFLEEHLDFLYKNAISLLKSGVEAQAATEDVESLFRQWHFQKNPPSLLALCLFLLDELDIQPAPDDLNMLIVSAILGDVRNNTKYHNNMHFRKVLAQAIRMIMCHNAIYENTVRALSIKEVCILLSSVCIHDLDHDGQGNWIKGVHIEGRAEKHSFETAKPYLKAVGCDEKTLQAIFAILLTTDVSPLDDPGNPMMQMKAAYRFHFMGENSKAHTLNLSENLKILEKDKALTTLCLFMHEADIATSAGMTYEITQYETGLIMEEFKEDKAYPADVVAFLNQICQRHFLSDAGQKLYAANIARIYALAEEDVKNGNQPFSKPMHADFLVPATHKGDDQVIN